MFTRAQIEKFRKLQTPFYYYDVNILRRNLQELKKIADQHAYQIHYALKANANLKILKIIREFGFGADCVSGNEIRRALEAGFAPQQIVFAGVGKTDAEIEFALENRIQCLNCESIQELEVVDQIARRKNVVAPIALRLNPGVSADTHEYITTGREEDKFGIPLQFLPEALQLTQKLKNINLVGIHFHIGSQITNLTVFENLCQKVNEIQDWFEERRVRLPNLNLGGGLGVDYENPLENLIPAYDPYFRIFKNNLKPIPGQQIHFELGRAVVAQCGALITRVIYIKQGLQKQFAIVDAGMTELIRPALYQAFHKIENLTHSSAETEVYDVVGPVCESSDFLGKGVLLPPTSRGDLLAILSTGAYAEVMASRYNLRDPAPAVYSDEL